jgi:exonuclease V gamma subunit
LRSLADAIRQHSLEEVTSADSQSFVIDRQHIVELSDLERAFVNPLNLFLRNTLGVFTFREDLTPDDATLPLESKNFKEVARSLLDGLLVDGPSFDVQKWRQTIRLTGLLPVGAFGESELLMAESLAQSFVDKADENGFHLTGLETADVELRLADQTLVRGTLPGIDVRADEPALVFTSFGTEFTDTPYWSDRKALAIRLLVLLAAESPVVCIRSIHRNKKPLDEGIARRIPVSIAEPIVDPLARIEILKEMYFKALSSPIGRFGATADKLSSDRDEARKTFDEFVRSERYTKSNEFICFGPDPDFDVVCAPGGAIEQYWTLAEQVIQIAPGRGKEAYAIS